MKYKHLFFDLDHTLWDFDTNSRLTLQELFDNYELEKLGIDDFELFHKRYLIHNELLWARYRSGTIKADDLRWKRMWLAMLDFKVGNETLARKLGTGFLHALPKRNTLFPHTVEVLQYLTDKKYQLHLITNGFEETQHSKLRYSGIDHFFIEVITSECSNSLKPNKEIFDYALLKTRSQCDECIMIGDSMEADIQGAINAGMDHIYVNHLNIVPTLKPTYTIYSLKELEDIL